MQLGNDWNRLQQVADQREAQQSLRMGGIGSIVFGVLALGLGLLEPIDPMLAGVGGVLLGTGVWNVMRPQAAGVVIEGLTLLIIGGFNISTIFLGDAFGGTLWVKLGVFQLVWGVQSIMRFQKYRTALAFESQETERRAFDEARKSLEKAKVKEATDVFQFVLKGWKAKAMRGRLGDDAVLLLKLGSYESLFVQRHEIDIQPGKKVMLGKDLHAVFAIGGETHKGTLSPESLERFQNWKYGVAQPGAIAA